ncbi:MAG: CRISPR-associated protein Cas4 [Ignavibacteriales bacterium]|nr:MAG: CRISPR-associated protein Cas4 [Ignavibacteriaceae bacterium]MBW7873860.1 CRISPR-associated protein Cas4 [Ignavibacteria bacterium]MCZ2143381.1 CRISPR-associated protein Cas4 [Ignavibacteriales bacterium]OQY79642.1 MAG: CRISPR-associated protein Cas4 [Ignavibacteriales bacterium UTCHB3]MBV6444261.1 CRISPR-associated exonuclease Cas4 [Ignavibacteriaceae bacterium]
MFSVTPTVIIEYLYCPRFTYFEHVLKIPQFEEKNYKVMKGRNIHEEKITLSADYLRKKIGVESKIVDVYLSDDILRGIVDEVLFLKDGTAAPLDYKFAVYDGVVYDTYKTQLYCYSWMIQKKTNRKVEKGFLVYTRSKNKLVEVPVTEENMLFVYKVSEEILALVQNSLLPDTKANFTKCKQCTYRNICPK